MKYDIATFASGCFWCTEAVFKRLRGVQKVVSGYTGGQLEHPSYEKVSMGTSGHAEAVQIEYDPEGISYETLVEVFFGTHDPTTLNQQGNDVGEQYRSVIFYHSAEQRRIAEEVMHRLELEKVFTSPIVTALEPVSTFFPAEDYHQNYYDENPDQAYCQVVIDPKLAKLRKKYAGYLKDTA